MIYSVLLFLHAAAGAFGLLSGPFAMFNQDGGRVHRIAGRIFYRSMMTVVFTGLYLAWYRQNLFLLLIAIFTFYLVFIGERALQHKRMHRGTKAGLQDWLVVTIAGIFGIAQLLYGCWLLQQGSSIGIVSIVFGSILSLRVFSDLKWFLRDNGERKTWLFVHIGNMTGAYIAALTAFLVQNIHIEPAFVVWIAPTVLISPFIAFTTRKFKTGKSKLPVS